MQCPACNHELNPMEAGGVVVDACIGGCGGVWFDNFELRKFDEPHESEGEALLNIERNPNVVVDHSIRRGCPSCAGIVMMRHSFSPQDNVEVDECPQCGGVWLDAGELAAIRERFATEEERAEVAKEWLDRTINTQIDRARLQDRQRQTKSERIAHLLRFVCPSNWLPAKQKQAAY